MTLRGRRPIVAMGYAALLLVSLIVRSRQASDSPIDARTPRAEVQAVDRERLVPASVRIAYDEYGTTLPGGGPIILLLHGSPGDRDNFRRMAPLLAQKARVIVPDLPGFGASSRELPDYSFRAHARYLIQLLDRLGIRRAHVVGYSMGGGAALSLLDLSPERVASLVMLSSIGLQELELTGDYYVNHLVHGAQLLGLLALREGTPHFGLLDRGPGVPYARNFFDSDQRPLRGVLQQVTVPTLLVHGTGDMLVPFDAAVEHHRLIPQSELVTFDSDHFMTFMMADELAGAIGPFVERVEAGRARSRGQASAERVRDAARVRDAWDLPRVRGIAATVYGGVLSATSMAAPLLTSTFAGLLAARGRINLVFAAVSCVLGALAGAGFRHWWRGDRPPNRWQAAGRRAGQTLGFVGAAGVLSWLLLRTPVTVIRSAYLRDVLVAALVFATIRLGAALSTPRRRRLLLSTWRRTTMWEFWPPWMFYPPLFAYLVWLMIKHRSATLFTTANPAILAGGFVGESKFDILRGLAGAGDFVARATLLDGSWDHTEKLSRTQAFMSSNGLTFPIVLKPNQGQRGSGVVVVRGPDMLSEMLARSSVDTIVQEYAGGDEFGVFYYRRPSEARGHVFSITEKRLTSVTGDGHRTLERLILDDDRAVCAAALYLQRHHDRLSTVPNDGVAVPLVELGSHCRGAMFLDGRAMWTHALEERFDTISKSFDGFFFGRYDVRVPGGREAFRAGQGFKILELNGVTAEATHIYHPGTPILSAYRVLMEQWRIAFEIGAENRARGHAPSSVATLMRLMREYSRSSRAHLTSRA